MQIYLVHHADAVGPGVDPQRPLSSVGLEQADEVARAIAARGFAPPAIWHSGKLRARQTAEACLRIAAPMAEFKMVRGLSPDDAPELMRTALLSGTRDLMLVGHMPNLPGLLSLLIGTYAVIPPHGAVAVESDDGGVTWREIWRFATRSAR